VVDEVILLNLFKSAYGEIRKKARRGYLLGEKYCNLIITSLSFALRGYNNSRIIAKALLEGCDESGTLLERKHLYGVCM